MRDKNGKRLLRKHHQQRDDDGTFWDHLTLMVPRGFEDAAREVAHRVGQPVTEYVRRALLLRLEADGVRWSDYADR